MNVFYVMYDSDRINHGKFMSESISIKMFIRPKIMQHTCPEA